jgi:putative solute:sodium symporter small subunit
LHQPQVQASLRRYWQSNLRIMASLTVVWLIAGLGCGVLFADKLNAFNLPGTGYPLGFWFAQQGSIICFVLIILTYCLLMNRLDVRHHAELEEGRNKSRSAP